MIRHVADFLKQTLPEPNVIRRFVLVFFLGIFVGGLCHAHKRSVVKPSGPSNAIVTVGHGYGVDLAKVYASAWEEGAKVLDQGKPISTGLEVVKTAWDRDRVRLFNRRLQPELEKVVSQGSDDKAITNAQRTALALAWRDFAKGLRLVE